MPELKHHFRLGRMNKDLDERLVENGEFRNAENIEIATSEGSDVGTVQNVVGNTKLIGKTYNASTGLVTADWSSNYIDDLTSPKCVGSIKDTQNDKIYWFIAATGVSAIAEYTESTNVLAPILVDKNSILNFSSSYPITGINIIEGLLLWTDNQSEPKKLKISTFKSGSTDFNTHTQFNSTDFTENDISVAKLGPISAPTLTMAASKRTGNGTGTTFVYTNQKFTDANEESLAPGTNVSLSLSPSANFRKDDILTLKYEDDEKDIFIIKVLIMDVNNWDPINSVAATITAKIQSIPTLVPDETVLWSVLLDEEQPMFEKKMVRFGYRWKYKDGEYSVFSPFSLPAFLPTNFEYKSTDGYNVGMINTLRSLTINLPDTQPNDVDEVDILYKESNNTLVYTVDTLKKNETSYEIKSEIIGSVVESNQILRPWDNVPRKALAQEITANRLIYGNYYQNYNILKQNLPDIETAITSNNITTSKSPEKSLKSQRTYQVGAVYRDAYGRETPVFSNKKAAKQIDKSFAENVNSLSCKLVNEPPEWATHYKYFIKETSNEYYNVALDRFYLADDGNVWLSFPSSERNKIKEDSYLILKKQHDKDIFVGTTARYKVLDIQNEAPKSIKMISKSVSNSVLTVLNSAVNAPQIGATGFQLRGQKYSENSKFADGINADGVITFTTSGGTSSKYKIKNGGLNGETEGSTEETKYIYDFVLQEPIKDEDSTILGSQYVEANDTLTIKLFEETEVEKAEFYGRFFVKVNRDGTFDTNIITSFPSLEAEFTIRYSREIDSDSTNNYSKDISDDGKTKKKEREDLCWKDTLSKINKINTAGHPKKGKDTFTVYWAGVDYGEDWKDNPSSQCKQIHNHSYKGKGRLHNELDSINPFLEKLYNSGTFIQFANASGAVGSVYEVIDGTIDYQYRSRDNRISTRDSIAGKRRAYNVTIKNTSTTGGYDDDFTFASNKITKINIMEKAIPPGNEVISSTNPCIFETEPKEAIDLDLYYEISNAFPIIKAGMKVTGTGIQASTTIVSITDANNFTLSQNSNAAVTNGTLTLTDSKGIYSFTVTATFLNTSTAIAINDGDFHGHTQALNWFNCYSFGNGVESDRLRDDYNAIRLDKGVKVSMPLAEQYKEEQKQNGLIWSGIFNSTSGLNRLNQFIQAEPITKDINPYYGSIQKIHGRKSDLIVFCEDQVLTTYANKDALYNADGSTNLLASNKVLGSVKPYNGEYGISKDPESFVSHSNFVFFSDKARGAICALDGPNIIPISESGMTDWFKDNLALATSVLGTYNQSKNSYNVTLNGTTSYTLSYTPKTKGWSSFKSFIPESGLSMNNKYYTFNDGEIWIHTNTTRNNFYGTQYESSVKVLLNDSPELIKGFKTLNYEGSKSRKYTYTGTIGSTKIYSQTIDQLVALGYTDSQISGLTQDTAGKGWYCNSITTNEATGSVRDFKEKEGKWFNYLRGDTTTLANVDSEEFPVQGVGNLASISGDTSVTGYDVSVTVTNTVAKGLKLVSVTDAAGSTSWSLDATSTDANGNVNKVIREDITSGTNLNTLSPLKITFEPTTGFSNPGSQAIDSQSPTTFNSLGYNTTSTNNTITLGYASNTLSADRNISLGLSVSGVASTYSIAGTYDVVSKNVDIKSSVNTAYSKTAAYLTNSAIDFGTPDNVAFTATAGYYFAVTPTCEVITEDSDVESFYTITTANTTTDSDGNVTKVTFTINYKHGAANITGDKLLFTAPAEKIFITPTVQVTGLIARESIISRQGENRTVTVNGIPTATFQITRRVGTWNDSDKDFDYAVKYFFDGDTWSLTPTTLTIGSTGSYAIAETFSSSSISKSFKYEIEEATLADPFAGSNPLVLYQYSDVTLTINAVTSSSNIHPGTGSSATADTVSAEYYSLGEPPSGTSARDIALEFFIYRDDSNDDAGDKLTPTSIGPTEDDFTYNPNIIKTATATDNTTAVTLASASDSIVAGMVVTSDSIGIKGTETAVTVSSISDTALVLSSSQAIPVDEELTFSPPLEWGWDVLNVAGAAAADTTATGSGSTGTAMTISAVNTAIKKGMHITGTNMHANASVTAISADGLTITMSDTSSGTMSGTYNFLGAAADATIYVYKVTADIEVTKFGTDDLISQLKVDNFLTPTAGSGGGGASTTAIVGEAHGANLFTGGAVITRHMLTTGIANSTTYSGTVTLNGNWDGNLATQVTPETDLSTAGTEQIASVTYGAVSFTSGVAGDGTATGGDTTGVADYVITIANDGGGVSDAADIITGYKFYIACGLVTTP